MHSKDKSCAYNAEQQHEKVEKGYVRYGNLYVKAENKQNNLMKLMDTGIYKTMCRK